MLFLNRLPRLHHPLLKNRRFAQVTHDRFFIVIECDDPKYSEPRPASCWKKPAASTSRWWRNNALLPCHLLRLCSLAVHGHRRASAAVISRKPPLYIFPDMDRQLKLRPADRQRFFANGISSHLPVAGTIARSQPIQIAARPVYPVRGFAGQHRPDCRHDQLRGDNPLPITAQLLRARAAAVSRSTARPATAGGRRQRHHQKDRRHGRGRPTCTTSASSSWPMGKFSTSSRMAELMGAYGRTCRSRIAGPIIAYLRALQLSRLGTIDDVPAAQLRANFE